MSEIRDRPFFSFSQVPTKRNGDCLEWVNKPTGSGYGVFIHDTVRWSAHRLAWEFANNKLIPKGMLVRHTCDNRICVNPKHLLLGTPKQNSRDAVDRNRMAKGERHYKAKIDDVSVQLIRYLSDCGVQHKRLAALYGYCESNISKITKLKSRGHVQDLVVF